VSGDTETTGAQRRRSGWLRLLPLLVILIGLAAALSLGLHKQLSFEALRDHRAQLAAFVAAQPALAVAAYLALYVAFTALMIPGALWITIAGGFLFGLAGGALATAVGATIGATLLFLVARTSLGEPLRRRAGPFLARLEAGFRENPFSYMLTLRFLPVVPFPVANIAPALLGAHLRDYVITTAVGILPGVVAYTWIGSGLGAAFDNGSEPNIGAFARQLLPAFLALAAVSIAPVLVKRLRGRRAT
jgi:uncharacterized membrane protein YdjX (TVP38/TMEM64 family)